MTDTLLFISGAEIFIILIAVLLLFGANKLPEIARGLGKGYNEFKKATHDIRSEFNEHTRDIKNEMNDFKDNFSNDINFDEVNDDDDEKEKEENTSSENENTAKNSKDDKQDSSDDIDDAYKNNPHEPK